MMKPKELLSLLEDRLVRHDNNRKEIQSTLEGICSDEKSLADSLEEKLTKEIQYKFEKIEEHILSIINKLNNATESNELDTLLRQAQWELALEEKFEISQNKGAKSFSDLYSLGVKTERRNCHDNEGEFQDRVKSAVNILQERLGKTHDSMIAAQDKVMEICARRMSDVDELRRRINAKLELLFTQEDAHIQKVVVLVRKNIGEEDTGKVNELASRVSSVLALEQKYKINKKSNNCSLGSYTVTAAKEASLEYLIRREKKPSIFATSMTDDSRIALFFTFFGGEELAVLRQLDMTMNAVVRILEEGCEYAARELKSEYKVGHANPTCFVDMIAPSTTYRLKMRLEYRELSSGWSDCTAFTTPDFKECAWRKCSDNSLRIENYSADERLAESQQ